MGVLWSFWQRSGKGMDKVRNMKECGMTGHTVVVARHSVSWCRV